MKMWWAVGFLVTMVWASDNPQVNIMVEDSMAAGTLYAKLLSEKPDVETYVALGDLYMQESKPIHAAKHYSKALTLDGNHAKAKEGLKKAEDRIDYLEKRIVHFKTKSEEANQVQNLCSASAILFHMGRGNDAFNVLRPHMAKNPNDPEAGGLLYTFKQGLEMRGEAASVIEQQFAGALSAKDLNQALTAMGQLVFVTLGTYPTEALTKQLSETFPEKIKPANLESAMEGLLKKRG